MKINDFNFICVLIIKNKRKIEIIIIIFLLRFIN
jgi:hypothetical protein